MVTSIATLGAAVGAGPAADRLVAALEARLAAARDRVAGARRPRTLVLEWTDPPYAPGHWVPEMIAAAGGASVLGAAGRPSERVTWEAVAASDPEVVVCAPCGFGLDAAAAAARDLLARGVLPPEAEVWAVDANASWARPGPRLVDGVEALAGILHPDRAGPPARDAATRVRP